MKYDFTDRVRLALARAREEALHLEHDYVGTEHILLGLLGAGGLADDVLDELSVDPGAVRQALLDAVRPGTRRVAMGELPYTSRAKKVLELAMAEARSMGDPAVCTAHMLIALFREEKGIAAQVLKALDVRLDALRRASGDLIRTEGPLERGGRRRSSVHRPFRIRIDDESSSSIYEQIVEQVREAVATGALRPGQRLPPVRRLADQLDIAPGTVARAYGELERRGVVVTEGARGTRVAEPQGEGPPPDERRDTLVGLLRPVAVAAFHMGATAAELRAALEPAMEGIFDGRDAA